MKVEFCQFSGIQTKFGQIKIKPIGKAKNSIQRPTLPGWEDVVSKIVIVLALRSWIVNAYQFTVDENEIMIL